MNSQPLSEDLVDWKASEAPISGRCAHCGLPLIEGSILNTDGRSAKQRELFCCIGCETVYGVIQQLGLGSFYEYRKLEGDFLVKPAQLPEGELEYLDDPLLLSEFVERVSPTESRVLLHLEGIHCAACVWLIEKLPHLLSGVTEARVNFVQGTVEVLYEPSKVTLSQISHWLGRLGYGSSPVRGNDALKEERRLSRWELTRIGIAAVIAANTMSLAISLYQGWFTGISAEYASLFSYTSLVLTIPAITFCAMPFYRAAIGGLRARSIHIDLPISVALLLAFFVSSANTLRGSVEVYYDTITALIFLLLGARYLQRRALARAVERTDLLSSLVPLKASRFVSAGAGGSEQGSWQGVYSGILAVGDKVRVEPGEVIPVDGVIVEGGSAVGAAILTGEALPVRVKPGNRVFAGTTNISSPITLVAESTLATSRISRIVNQIDRGDIARAPIIDLTDQLSSVFVVVVLLLSLLCFLFWGWSLGFEEGFNRTLALLVVTCPCALGLAAPITLAIAVRRAARHGLFIRSSDAIQRIADANELVFDKTGTVTEGKLEVRRFWLAPEATKADPVIWDVASDLHDPGVEQRLTPIVSAQVEFFQAVLSLENGSSHPVGIAIRNFLAVVGERFALDKAVDDRLLCEPVLGRGVKGFGADGAVWRIGSSSWLTEELELCGENQHAGEVEFRKEESLSLMQRLTPIFVSRNSVILAGFGIGDTVRQGIKECIAAEQARGTGVTLLSGDHPEVVEAVGVQLGVSAERCLGGKSPEEKAAFVLELGRTRRTAFFGDGVNDALVLRAAGVGVGVAGGAEVALRVSDAFIATPSTARFSALLSGARLTMRAIYRNLFASVTYNVIGAGAAFLGYVNPLVAAILMPISSLTVVFIASFSNTFQEQDGKEQDGREQEVAP